MRGIWRRDENGDRKVRLFTLARIIGDRFLAPEITHFFLLPVPGPFYRDSTAATAVGTRPVKLSAAMSA